MKKSPHTTHVLLSLLTALTLGFASCENKKGQSDIYHRELLMVDSIKNAYHLSEADTTISDFFMKEVRYQKFGVSIYRLEDAANRFYLFAIVKNDATIKAFPLFDNRLLEENKLGAADTNHMDKFLNEIVLLNGNNRFNWFEKHQFISEKVLLPILDLHEIQTEQAKSKLKELTSDTNKIIINGKDCREELIKTYSYVVAQQKINAPTFFYKHPRYDEGLIYEVDFANPSGDFKVRYLNEKCFHNKMP